MYRKKTSAQLKQAARGVMIGKYKNAISILLASDFIISALTLITSTSTNSYFGILISLVVNFILILIASILNVGQCSFYLNIACEQPFLFSDLFYGFKVHPDKTIITQVVIQLLAALPTIPAIILMITAISSNNVISLFLPACILLILGIGLSWWISLIYSQVYYLLLDFPDYSAMKLLKMSRKLMKGNVGRLIYLQVSFIPLNLAGLLSFGIGLLFVLPYQNMTYTLFYLDMIQTQNQL